MGINKMQIQQDVLLKSNIYVCCAAITLKVFVQFPVYSHNHIVFWKVVNIKMQYSHPHCTVNQLITSYNIISYQYYHISVILISF